MTDAELRGERVTIAKAVALVAGALTFGAGIRADSAALRWIGIGLVALAWLLRLLKVGPAPSEPSSPMTPDSRA